MPFSRQPAREALHERERDGLVQASGRDVVEEEERPRALREEIVDEWFTRSRPSVSCRPAARATRTLVPTPSADATRTGSSHPRRPA